MNYDDSRVIDLIIFFFTNNLFSNAFWSYVFYMVLVAFGINFFDFFFFKKNYYLMRKMIARCMSSQWL